MAGIIDILISEAAKADLEAAIAKVSALEAKILKLNESIRKNASSGRASSSGGVSSSGGASSGGNNVELQLRKQLEATTKKLDLANTKLNKALIAEKETLRLVTAEIKAQVASTNPLIGVYAKADQELKKLQKDSQNLAFQLEELRSKGQTETEQFALLSRQYEETTKQAVTLSGKLGAVDRSLGLGRRFVGNYENATRGLSNSINQVTRELPSFAFSAQTGFLAISNNLPILVDEIGRLTAANKALIKTGAKVPSVFGSIVKSIFSWQTALSVGVSLLVIYGKEIGNFVTSLFQLKKVIDVNTESQKALNKANKEGRDDAQAQVTRVKTIIDALKSENISSQRKLELAKELRGIAPGLFKDITDQEIATSDLTAVTDKLNKALIARGQIAKLNKTIEEAEIKRQEKINEIGLANEELVRQQIENRERENDLRKQGITPVPTNTLEQEQKIKDLVLERVTAEEIIRKAREEILKLENNLTGIFDEQIEKSKKLNEERGKAQALVSQDIRDLREFIELLDNMILAFSSFNNPEFTATLVKIKELAQLKLDFLFDPQGTLDEIAEKTEKGLKDIEDKFKKKSEAIKELFESNLSKIKLDILNRKLDDALSVKSVKKVLKEIKEAEKQQRDERIKELEKLLNTELKLKENATEEEIKRFTDAQNELNSLNQQKLDERVAAFEKAQKEMERAGAILKDSLIDFVNAVFDNRVEKIDAELNKLDEFFSEQLELAEGDAEQKKRIEKERRIQEKKLEKERLEAVQKQAIFNKAINVAETIANTASSIVRANKDIPFPFSLIVGGLYAAIGTAQLATIIAAPIPQFKEGVTNFKGGKAILGDGGVKEVVTDKDMNPIYVSPNKPTLVDLPKGANVFKDEASFMRSLSLNFAKRSEVGKNDNVVILSEVISRGIKKGFKQSRINNNVFLSIGRNKDFRL